MIDDGSVKKWFSRENDISTIDYDTALKSVVKTVILPSSGGPGSSFETTTTSNLYTDITHKYKKRRKKQFFRPKTGGLVRVKKD